MLISVICATIGPLRDVDRLLLSLHESLCNLESHIELEFILVDQSDGGAEDHAFPSSDLIRLLHIKNPTRGLSINRNIGLARASGQWVLFIDSDCVIQSDYFSQFLLLHRAHPGIDRFVGQVLVLQDGATPLFRRWPQRVKSVSSLMNWYYSTSVNSIFRPRSTLRFDELFGLGAKYGSCEDLDFFVRLKSKTLYSPALITHHPNYVYADIPRDKLNSYSHGFGALCAKHFFPYGAGMLVMSLFFKAFNVVTGKASVADLKDAGFFRIKGFASYLRSETRNHA